MPLIESTSKSALGKNIAKERKAGKPLAQAVAIGFAEKRKAIAKKIHKEPRDWKEHKAHRYSSNCQYCASNN